MIKLKQLIPENTTQNEFDDDYIIIGTIHDSGVIDSTKTTDGNSTHSNLGYRDVDRNWRYNPITQTVYWYELREAGFTTRRDIEKHLKQKYNVDVVAHKGLHVRQTADRMASNQKYGDDQDKRDKETHPFNRNYHTYVPFNL